MLIVWLAKSTLDDNISEAFVKAVSVQHCTGIHPDQVRTRISRGEQPSRIASFRQSISIFVCAVIYHFALVVPTLRPFASVLLNVLLM